MIRTLTLEETRKYIRDDTVRPHLSAEFRTQENREVWALFEDQSDSNHEPSPEPLAIICVAYAHGWPENESELDRFSLLTGTATIEPPVVDAQQYNRSRFHSLQEAFEYAREIQGELSQCDNGTIVNSLGEVMQYDSEGNLAPCSRSFELQLEQNTMVFYTVWSYKRGSGAQLVRAVAEHARDHRTDIWHWVTLSPLTQMAEQFHTKNGAVKHAVFEHNQIFNYSPLILTEERLSERMRQVRDAEQARSALR